jgi:N-acetylglucosaminyldiphosphoundecaprenol N-acetyl-beta-D-mannosaminyltransferase
MKKYNIFDIDKKIINYYGMEILLKKEKYKIITFVNIYSYYVLFNNKININKIKYIFIDGIIQIILHNIFHKNKVSRVSFDFSSIADDFFIYAVKNKLRIAIIGAKENEINAAVKNLKIKYSNLNIVYFRNGYFDNEIEKTNMLSKIKEMNIDIVLLGMGTPKQELLAINIIDYGIDAIIFTCGGFLTQTAKNIFYYKINYLRWLQRAIDYKHIRLRLFINYPVYIIRYIINHIIP